MTENTRHQHRHREDLPQDASLRLALATMLSIAVGCGGPANKYDSIVTGTVTINGELAKSGTVTFHPVAKDGKIAIGRIYDDGSFSLRTGQGNLKQSDGGTVPSGEYIVAIAINGPRQSNASPEGAPPTGGPLLIADKYVSKETSDLRAKVKPGKNVLTFDLQPATPSEMTDQAANSSEQGTGASQQSAEGAAK